MQHSAAKWTLIDGTSLQVVEMKRVAEKAEPDRRLRNGGKQRRRSLRDESVSFKIRTAKNAPEKTQTNKQKTPIRGHIREGRHLHSRTSLAGSESLSKGRSFLIACVIHINFGSTCALA